MPEIFEPVFRPVGDEWEPVFTPTNEEDRRQKRLKLEKELAEERSLNVGSKEGLYSGLESIGEGVLDAFSLSPSRIGKTVEDTIGAGASAIAGRSLELKYKPSRQFVKSISGHEIPSVSSSPSDPWYKQVGAGAVNAPVNFLNFLQTPEAIAFGGLKAIPASTRKVVEGILAGSIGGESIAHFNEQVREGDIAGATTTAISGPAFTALLGKQAVEFPSRRMLPQEIMSAVPAREKGLLTFDPEVMDVESFERIPIEEAYAENYKGKRPVDKRRGLVEPAKNVVDEGPIEINEWEPVFRPAEIADRNQPAGLLEDGGPIVTEPPNPYVVPLSRRLPNADVLTLGGPVNVTPEGQALLKGQTAPIPLRNVEVPDVELRAELSRTTPIKTPSEVIASSDVTSPPRTDVGGGKLGFAGKSAEEISLPLKESPPKEEGFFGRQFESEPVVTEPKLLWSNKPTESSPPPAVKLSNGQVISDYGAKSHRGMLPKIPEGVEIVDVGFIKDDGEFQSYSKKGDPYLKPEPTPLPTAVEAAFKRIAERGQKLGTNPNPFELGEMLKDLATVGFHYAKQYGKDFARWSVEMVKNVGEWAKPHLEQIWKDITTKDKVYGFGVNDQVGRLGTESAKYISDKLTSFTADVGRRVGEFVNQPSREIRKAPKQVRQSLYEKLIAQNRTGIPATFTAEEKPLNDYLRKHIVNIRDIANNLGIQVDGRLGKINPTYFQNIMKPEFKDAILRDPDSALAQKVKDDVVQHYVNEFGITPTEASNIFEGYRQALGNPFVSDSNSFNALNRAEGMGLPRSVLVDTLQEAVAIYGERAARHIATFEHLEGDPVARKILNLKDQEGKLFLPNEDVSLPSGASAQVMATIPKVQNALKEVYRTPKESNKVFAGVSKLTHSTIMGALTGARDVGGLWKEILPYVKVKDLDVFVRAWGGLKEGYTKSFDYGVTRKGMLDYLFNENPQNYIHNKALSYMDKLSGMFYVGGGRGPMENFGRALSWATSDILTRRNFIRAQTGNVEARAYLQKFGDIVPGGVGQYFVKGKVVPQEVIDLVNKRVVDRVQQEYNANDQPSSSLRGELAPFLALSRWDIGRMNNLYKDVVVPAIRGNPAALIKYTLGSFLTGAAMQQLMKYINNKKDYNPSPAEMVQDDTKWQQQVAGVINLFNMGNYMGFAGSVLKVGSDVVLAGTKPRGFGIPAVTAVVETTEDIGDMIEAYFQGEDKMDVLLGGLHKIANSFIQDYRLVANHLDDEIMDRKDKFRDVNMYNRLTKNKSKEISDSNTLLGQDAREFKRADDMGEAVKLLPSMVDRITKADNPMNEAMSLKGNSYQTMPSPVDNKVEFAKYYDWLVRTQGQEEADKRVADYMKQNALNSGKSKLLPPFPVRVR